GYTDATFAGATATGTITAAFTSATSTGTAVNNDDTTSVPITTATQLVGTAGTPSNDLPSGGITNGSTLVVNGKTITFSTANTTTSGSAASGFTIGIGAGSTNTVQTVLSDIDAIAGGSGSTVSAGALVLQTGTTSSLPITGSGNALSELGLGSGAHLGRPGRGPPSAAGDALTVNGKTLTFVTGAAGTNQISTTGTVANLLAAIDTASGASGSTVSGGSIILHTGTINGTLSISSTNANALAALGLTGGVTQAATGAPAARTGA